MKLYMAYLDIEQGSKQFEHLPKWVTRTWGPFNYREGDYGELSRPKASGIAEEIRNKVRRQLGFEFAGPIMLLTNVRSFGYVFNPISVYYCFQNADDDQSVVAMILEVTNTPWGQRHFYVVDARNHNPQDQYEFKKEMHVSPFFDTDMRYVLTWKNPSEVLDLRLDVFRGDTKSFYADIKCRQFSVGWSDLRKVLLRHPFHTFKVSLGIHAHALALVARRIKFHPLKSLTPHNISTTAVKNRKPVTHSENHQND